MLEMDISNNILRVSGIDGLLNGRETDRKLLERVKHDFDAYQRVVPWLKNRKAELDNQHWSSRIIDDLLFLADIPETKPPELKVGDVIEAKDVPFETKIELEFNGNKEVRVRKNGRHDDESSINFDCVSCGTKGSMYIRPDTPCTILELPK